MNPLFLIISKQSSYIHGMNSGFHGENICLEANHVIWVDLNTNMKLKYVPIYRTQTFYFASDTNKIELSV